MYVSKVKETGNTNTKQQLLLVQQQQQQQQPNKFVQSRCVLHYILFIYCNICTDRTYSEKYFVVALYTQIIVIIFKMSWVLRDFFCCCYKVGGARANTRIIPVPSRNTLEFRIGVVFSLSVRCCYCFFFCFGVWFFSHLGFFLSCVRWCSCAALLLLFELYIVLIF